MSATGTNLEVRGVTRRFRSGGRPLVVLDRVSLSIDASESVAIVGPSGSGKSTLLALMAGLDRPDEGSILLEGEALEKLSEDRLARLRRAKLGFVFQSFHLLDNLTALENVLLPMEMAGVKGARERARGLLAEVGLAARTTHYPSQLSGGEQQRVALARAFGPNPSLLLADEPTGNLDRENGALVLELLERMQRERGATLVIVTHDPAVARRARRRIELVDGRVAADEARADEKART